MSRHRPQLGSEASSLQGQPLLAPRPKTWPGWCPDGPGRQRAAYLDTQAMLSTPVRSPPRAPACAACVQRMPGVRHDRARPVAHAVWLVPDRLQRRSCGAQRQPRQEASCPRTPWRKVCAACATGFDAEACMGRAIPGWVLHLLCGKCAAPVLALPSNYK